MSTEALLALAVAANIVTALVISLVFSYYLDDTKRSLRKLIYKVKDDSREYLVLSLDMQNKKAEDMTSAIIKDHNRQKAILSEVVDYVYSGKKGKK